MALEREKGVKLGFLNRPDVNIIPGNECMAIMPRGGIFIPCLGFIQHSVIIVGKG